MEMLKIAVVIPLIYHLSSAKDIRYECHNFTREELRALVELGKTERDICERITGRIFTGGKNANYPGCGGCSCCKANGSPTKATTIFPPVMTSGPTPKTTSTRFRRRITCYVCFEDRHCNNFDSASILNVRTEECPGVCFTQTRNGQVTRSCHTGTTEYVDGCDTSDPDRTICYCNTDFCNFATNLDFRFHILYMIVIIGKSLHWLMLCG